jgi:hypothetical protein
MLASATNKVLLANARPVMEPRTDWLALSFSASNSG